MKGSFKAKHVAKVLHREVQYYSQANGLIGDGTKEEWELRQASVLHWRFITESVSIELIHLRVFKVAYSLTAYNRGSQLI